ncbi:MAG: DUF4332 domain-containing protein [Anaerolineae bacterium]
MVSDTDERNTSWIMLAFFFLVVALLFWLWIMREQRSASEIAEDTLDTAEDKLRKLEEQAKAQISPTDEADAESEPEPVAEAVVEPEPQPVAEEVVDDQTEPTAATDTTPETIAVEVEEDDDTDGDVSAPAQDEPDDLSRIEGIGPKYSEILIGAGISTFAQIAEMNEEQIIALIKENGGRRSASMATWAEQAKLAAAGDWEELARLQEELSGGRRD